MELARSLRKNQFRIKLCEYSYELLLQYLQKTQALVVLGIINERTTFDVSPGQPSLISDDTDVVALVGTKKDLAKQINLKEVHWGVWSASVLLTAIACSIYLLMIWIQQIETIHTNQLFDGILSFSLNF
jgi:transcription initiation factor TFIID subunit 5